MGYTGDLVPARCDTPLERLPVLGDPARCIEEFDAHLEVCGPRPRGRQTLRLGTGLPDDGHARWLDAHGRGDRFARPDRERLRQRRPPRTRPHALRRGTVRLPRPGDGRRPRADWAAEAGLTADPKALREVLSERADPFVEDLFLKLIDACGLPPARPEGEDPVEIDPLAHPGHRPVDGGPHGVALEKAVQNLPRDGNLVLECAADAQCYAQVWHRPDGTYQLEYRDRAPAEHYLTRTVSPEKVVAALQGWTAGGAGWRDAFQWEPIGSWFTDV